MSLLLLPHSVWSTGIASACVLESHGAVPSDGINGSQVMVLFLLYFFLQS